MAMRRRAYLLAVALMVGALVVGSGVAYSHDHVPPKTALMKGESQLQRGILGSYCWTSPGGEGLVIECGDVFRPSFPPTDYVRAGRRLHIRILKAQEPVDFSLRAYGGKAGHPTGTGEQLPVSLRPVQEDGTTVAWDAFFEVDSPGRHYYMFASGRWKDEQGGGNLQDASWTFHIKTKS
jgi:hypothetical protein